MTNIVSQTDERSISAHQEHEFLKKLETAGLNSKLAQKVIDSKDNYLAEKVIRLIQGGFEPMTSQKYARKIMGKNFFGIEETIKYFGVNPSRQQLTALSEIPFSEAILEQLKDTHVLVAVFLPLPVSEIRSKVKLLLFRHREYPWYYEQAFTEEYDEVSWQLVRKIPVDNSTSKNWQEQQALVGKDDEVPSFQTMLYTIAGHYLTTGKYLFEHTYVRTSSVFSNGGRISIGSFDSESLNLDYYWDSDRYYYLGIAASRKPQILSP